FGERSRETREAWGEITVVVAHQNTHGGIIAYSGVLFFWFALPRELSRCNKLTCGSRTAVGVLSLACPRESTQREGHPGRCAAPPYKTSVEGPVPCAPHQPRARDELAGAQQITARARARPASRAPPPA